MPIEVPSVRILIVDDDKAICDFMQSLLEKDGFIVKTLSDPTLVEEEIRTDTAVEGFARVSLEVMAP